MELVPYSPGIGAGGLSGTSPHAFSRTRSRLGRQKHQRRLRPLLLRRVLRAGGAVLEVTETLGDDDAIVAWVRRWDAEAGAEGLLLGVDAPLLVPNETGKRPCETELGRRFAKFQAGAHPANRTIFGDDVRGERLVARLAGSGYRP